MVAPSDRAVCRVTAAASVCSVRSLRDEIITTTARVSDLLCALPDGDLPLSRVSWSAAELGAHLVSLPRRYRRTAQTPAPFPASLSADNHRELAAVSERAPGALADLLEVEVATLLEAFGADGEQPVWYFTVAHTVTGVGAILLGELLLHGLDLARACQRSWPITRAQALACLRGVLPAIILAVDVDAAPKGDGTYHLDLRGGEDWTVRRARGRRSRRTRASAPGRSAPVHRSGDVPPQRLRADQPRPGAAVRPHHLLGPPTVAGRAFRPDTRPTAHLIAD